MIAPLRAFRAKVNATLCWERVGTECARIHKAKENFHAFPVLWKNPVALKFHSR